MVQYCDKMLTGHETGMVMEGIPTFTLRLAFLLRLVDVIFGRIADSTLYSTVLYTDRLRKIAGFLPYGSPSSCDFLAAAGRLLAYAGRRNMCLQGLKGSKRLREGFVRAVRKVTRIDRNNN